MIDDSTLKSGRLLLVDAPDAVQFLARSLLQSGYVNVSVATDGCHAVDLFRELQPDLVILDVNVPGNDSLRVIDEIRLGMAKDDFCPILALSADGSQPLRRRVLAGGANDFVTKPIDFVEFMLRIRNLLEVRYYINRLLDDKRALETRLRKALASA